MTCFGVAANEKNVKSMDLSNRKVIAFATHGLVPGDLNGLEQPALALTAPEVAGIDGDGLLTMDEILGLKLNADWVVLSACNTASGDGAGAEAVSGLGRAFFYAGARALLVSNWPVETRSARLLTTDLFKRQSENPNLTRAEALRQTMLGLMDKEGNAMLRQAAVFLCASNVLGTVLAGRGWRREMNPANKIVGWVERGDTHQTIGAASDGFVPQPILRMCKSTRSSEE